MKDDIKNLCITGDYTVMEAIRVLDETHERIVLVLDGELLIGILTDSDVRRWILRSNDLDAKVTEAMTPRPITVKPDEIHGIRELMEKHSVDAIPVVTKNGTLVDLIFRYESDDGRRHYSNKTDAPVVIMAGGKGTRLYPYTNVLPKPLIPIGNETIIEKIISSFGEAGCTRFYLSVNYKKNLIKAYFKDLDPGYSIDYLEEEEFLGTGGSLYLAKDKIKEPFFVSNCDILLDVDYAGVMDFHKKNNNAITLITSLKNYTIPYGIVHTAQNGFVESLSEKPEMNFQVNTGVYILNPEVLSYINEGEFMHITQLIQTCMDNGLSVGAYPITERAWEDMGEIAGMESMLKDIKEKG